jgi:hypothetical protein
MTRWVAVERRWSGPDLGYGGPTITLCPNGHYDQSGGGGSDGSHSDYESGTYELVWNPFSHLAAAIVFVPAGHPAYSELLGDDGLERDFPKAYWPSCP